MKFPTLDGWLSWSFNDQPCGIRKSKQDKYKFHVSDYISNSEMLYKEALYNNASVARDYFSEPFDVLFSGGIDSEIVLRTFKDLGISHNTFIFRYKNGYNKFDVDSAIEISKCLNIPYKVIDFDLENFFENEAFDFFQKSGCLNAPRLAHLKFFDFLDNIPVMGESEPYWKRLLKGDYSRKSEWKFSMSESFNTSKIYLHSTGRDQLCNWYEFTPQVISAYNKHPFVKNLLDDKIYGKQSNWSSRVLIHKEIWPDIKEKPKLTGFEVDKIPGIHPEFINNFQIEIDKTLGKGDDYLLTIEEVNSVFY
jgi:hypothetical protein